MWRSNARRPRIFQDRERTDSAPFASMHAKCLLVDAKDLLVTSANFTFHGLHGNIEIGVRLSGSPAAEARKIFSHLVEHRIVEELVE
jgi:phosphatidylserine/phosphatidylglycerophosphate/cardiolipin synthase-like enzyme